MHQFVSADLDSSRRWAVLAIVVGAQFMFGVDAFIVDVKSCLRAVGAGLRRRLVTQRSAARRRGTLVLIEGCAIQVVGLAALMLVVASIEAPGAWLMALVLTIFGYGQGLVMAPCPARCFPR